MIKWLKKKDISHKIQNEHRDSYFFFILLVSSLFSQIKLLKNQVLSIRANENTNQEQIKDLNRVHLIKKVGLIEKYESLQKAKSIEHEKHNDEILVLEEKLAANLLFHASVVDKLEKLLKEQNTNNNENKEKNHLVCFFSILKLQ